MTKKRERERETNKLTKKNLYTNIKNEWKSLLNGHRL